VEGIDLSARLGFDAWGGSGLIDATVTRLLDNERKVTPSAPFDDLLGDPNFPARWRGRAGAEWSRGAVTVGLSANYVSGGRDPIGGRGIDDWTTFDSQVRYEVSEGLALTLSVRNLANAEPPFFDAPQGIGYDAANTDVLGRQVAFQLVRRW
jgi:iron complex outermembrane receptor protein